MKLKQRQWKKGTCWAINGQTSPSTIFESLFPSLTITVNSSLAVELSWPTVLLLVQWRHQLVSVDRVHQVLAWQSHYQEDHSSSQQSWRARDQIVAWIGSLVFFVFASCTFLTTPCLLLIPHGESKSWKSAKDSPSPCGLSVCGQNAMAPKLCGKSKPSKK